MAATKIAGQHASLEPICGRRGEFEQLPAIRQACTGSIELDTRAIGQRSQPAAGPGPCRFHARPADRRKLRCERHAHSSAKYLSFFLQDDIRVRNNLTLNLGIRYEKETANIERWNRAARGFDAAANLSITAAAKAAYTASQARYCR